MCIPCFLAILRMFWCDSPLKAISRTWVVIIIKLEMPIAPYSPSCSK